MRRVLGCGGTMSALASTLSRSSVFGTKVKSTMPLVILSAILLASFSQQQFHHLIVVDAMKLTSLGSVLHGSSSSSVDGEVVNEERKDIDYSSLVCSTSATCSPSTSASSYGVDRSFPIHHHDSFAEEAGGRVDAVGAVVEEEGWLQDKQQFYQEYMEGCRQAYRPEGYRCDISEEERMEMNLRQPASMMVCFMSIYLVVAKMECIELNWLHCR
jgi:hypothetical protein